MEPKPSQSADAATSENKRLESKGDTKETKTSAPEGGQGGTASPLFERNMSYIIARVKQAISHKQLQTYKIHQMHYRVVAANLATVDIKSLFVMLPTTISSGTEADFLEHATARQPVPDGTCFVCKVENAATQASAPLFFTEDGQLIKTDKTPLQVLCEGIKLNIDAATLLKNELGETSRDLESKIEQLENRLSFIRKLHDDQCISVERLGANLALLTKG